MWLDNASEIDMLFYKPYSDLILNTIKNKNLNPLTIGLFGGWGAGKSTLLHMIESGISEDNDSIVCLNLNAWMFEGYDDAKSALMESLLKQIEEKETKFGEITGSLKSLLKRVKYFKLGTDALSKGIPLLTSIVTGNPLPFALSFTGDLASIMKEAPDAIENLKNLKEKYITEEEKESIVQNIRLFKKEFSDLLKSSKIDNLVVIIDDLDRCNPERIIETLEAVKLFLAVPKTTFIIAVDERVIEYSIKRKYPQLDEKSIDISKDYIEKIIQLPIYIPELSSKDIENYLMILIIQLYLNQTVFTEVLNKLYSQKCMLEEKSMTIDQLVSLFDSAGNVFNNGCTKEIFDKDLKTINSIKDIISANLKGNPRQAKRFLNTFITKKTLSTMYFQDDIDVQIMAKLLALQTIDIDAFRELNEWNKQFDGEIKQLKIIYEHIEKDTEALPTQFSRWGTPKMHRWMLCEPKELYKENLSKYFYLSRDVLNQNNDLIGELLVDEKNMLQEIIHSSEGTLDTVIGKLEVKSPDSIDKIIKVLIRKFDDGDVKLSVIRRIFIKFQSYRGMVIGSIGKMSKEALGISSVPHLIQILRADSAIVKPVFDQMKDGKMPIATYNAIFVQPTIRNNTGTGGR